MGSKVIRKISINDPGYPKNLKTIHSPPKQLYVNGSLKEEDSNAVGIVGSRRATPYGIEMAERLAYDIASRGVTIISGMARGIDSAAHKGALKAGGRTIAVMGSGHGCIYPPENRELYAKISENGAVMTEFEDDMEPLPRNFPIRNRIISGLSLGLIVVEAARNSGALITADFALEQGREVFAVPGKISSATSSGTNELIKDGARLIQTSDDVLEALKFHQIENASGGDKESIERKISKKTRAYIYNSLTKDEKSIYKALSDEPVYIDEIARESKVAPGNVAKAILSLQMKRVIKELPGKNFVRTENV
jgi:DNA processing protein